MSSGIGLVRVTRFVGHVCSCCSVVLLTSVAQLVMSHLAFMILVVLSSLFVSKSYRLVNSVDYLRIFKR